MIRYKSFGKIIMLAFGVLLSLCACTASKDGNPAALETQGNTQNEDPIVIGATLASEHSSYLSSVSEYMKKAAADAGVELILKYADWDVNTQIQQLAEFREQRVDVIILCPVNAKSMLVPLKHIGKSNIPVINLNMRVDAVSSVYTDCYVGASNSEEGALAAEMIISMLGDDGGQVAIIEGAPGSDAQIYRTQTFVEQLAATPQIVIAGIGNGEWERERARLAAWDLIRKNPLIQAIYCHDSNMAMGAIQTVEELGLNEQIRVIGISEMPEYIQAVRDGRLYGFISQPPEYEGITCIEKAIDAANGLILRPWFKDPIQKVTQANVDSFESGFRSTE